MLCLCMLVVLCCCGGRKKVVRSQADLPGSRIGVQLGTVADTKASAMEHDKEGTQVERFTKTADAIQALMQGKVDC